MYTPGCLIQRLAELPAPHIRRQKAGDERPEEAGRWRTVVAEIMMSDDIRVWI
jgi:hypothetical protein